MRFSLEIGAGPCRLDFYRNWFTGGMRITVDGRLVAALSPWSLATHSSPALVRRFEFFVGYSQPYHILVEHERPRWFAGIRPHTYRVFVDGEEVTLASAPPAVIKTVPVAGADDVDPALKEIQVTFSKDMKDATWSWGAQTKDAFPKLDGRPRYLADKRTCVLPVKLEPGKTYALWINTAKLTGFQDADGRPAVPYLLVFQTKK